MAKLVKRAKLSSKSQSRSSIAGAVVFGSLGLLRLRNTIGKGLSRTRGRSSRKRNTFLGMRRSPALSCRRRTLTGDIQLRWCSWTKRNTFLGMRRSPALSCWRRTLANDIQWWCSREIEVSRVERDPGEVLCHDELQHLQALGLGGLLQVQAAVASLMRNRVGFLP